MGVVRTGGTELTICKFCSNREMISHSLDGRHICGSCIKKREPKEAPEKEEEAKKVEDVGTLPKSHVVLEGRVYDITPRPIECKHGEARNLEKLLSKKFNFCQVCGGYLRRREIKPKLQAKKAKKKIDKADKAL